MTSRKVQHLTLEERRNAGKEARARVPRSSVEGWEPSPDRPDPVDLIEQQNATREPDLVPVRHGRMMVSPFTFYRGGAKIMAADLRHIPRAGLNVHEGRVACREVAEALGYDAVDALDALRG